MTSVARKRLVKRRRLTPWTISPANERVVPYPRAALDLQFLNNRAFIQGQQYTLEEIITFTRASGGGRYNAQGTYEWVGSNIPRYDYDPVTKRIKGLLVEEARTNLLTYSEDFSNAAWAKSGTTISADVVISPAGVMSADKVVEGAINAPHRVTGANTSITSGVTYTASVFVKSAGNNRKLEFRNYTGSSDVITIADPDTGTVVSGPGSFTYVGSGWYRLSQTFTATASVSSIFIFQCYLNNGTSAYLGNGTSGLYIWGAQLEAGEFATSYIPTVASQVTRAADVASVNTLSPWYNAVEGTLFVEATTLSITSPFSRYAASLNMAASPNNILIGFLASGAKVFYGHAAPPNAEQWSLQSSQVVPGIPVKIAGSYAVNSARASFDGSPVLEDTSVVVPTSISVLGIGRGWDSSRQLNGHIQNIRYYGEKFSDSDLQILTTPQAA